MVWNGNYALLVKRYGRTKEFCSEKCEQEYISPQRKAITLDSLEDIEKIGLEFKMWEKGPKHFMAHLDGPHILCDIPSSPCSGWSNVFATERTEELAKEKLKEILNGKTITVNPREKGQTTYTINFSS